MSAVQACTFGKLILCKPLSLSDLLNSFADRAIDVLQRN